MIHKPKSLKKFLILKVLEGKLPPPPVLNVSEGLKQQQRGLPHDPTVVYMKTPKKVSDGEIDQALILVKLTCDFSGLTVSQLVRFLRKYHRAFI